LSNHGAKEDGFVDTPSFDKHRTLSFPRLRVFSFALAPEAAIDDLEEV